MRRARRVRKGHRRCNRAEGSTFLLYRNLRGRSRRGLIHGGEGKPEAKVRTPLAVGPVQHLDPSTVRERVLAGDRESQPRALDAPFRRGLALIERLEDSGPILRVDARPLIDDVEYGMTALGVELERDQPGARRILDRVGQ